MRLIRVTSLDQLNARYINANALEYELPTNLDFSIPTLPLKAKL